MMCMVGLGEHEVEKYHENMFLKRDISRRGWSDGRDENALRGAEVTRLGDKTRLSDFLPRSMGKKR